MFDRFRKKTYVSVGTPEFIVVGLGNPGRKYTLTRHNSGFLCIDMLSQKLNFRVDRLKFKSLIADTTINGHRCIVMKPQTFMNNSGEAIRECAAFYKIKPENIIVIYDDISLPPGQLRIRKKGSAGGHNGIKNIISTLGRRCSRGSKWALGRSRKDMIWRTMYLDIFPKKMKKRC